jgi:hypothetical protein
MEIIWSDNIFKFFHGKREVELQRRIRRDSDDSGYEIFMIVLMNYASAQYALGCIK